MTGFVKTIPWVLAPLTGQTLLFVSQNIGFPFRVKAVTYVGYWSVDVNMRLRFFSAIDGDTALITVPSGTNLFAQGVGDAYFNPDDDVITLSVNMLVPHYNRHLKVQAANATLDNWTVTGSFIVEDAYDEKVRW